MRDAFARLSLILLSALAPQEPRDESPTICAGERRELKLVAGVEGVVLRLQVRVVEPLTIFSEAVDSDVLLRIEDPASGAVLLEDDDGGIATEAWLRWRPEAAGTVLLRVLAKGPVSGVARIYAIRGSIDPLPPEPKLASRAYWQNARYWATRRGDEARIRLADEHLSGSDGTGAAGREADAAVDEAVHTARVVIRQVTAAHKAGDLERARAAAKEAEALLVAVPGGDEDARVIGARMTLGILAFRLDEIRIARSALEPVTAFLARTLPADHPFLQTGLGYLADVLVQLGDLETARALEERVLAAYERTFPDDHRNILTARGQLASTLRAMGDLGTARRLSEQVLLAFERLHPSDDLEVQRARVRLGTILFDCGDVAAARSLFERTLAVRERQLPSDHPDVAVPRQNLALCLLVFGDAKGARLLLEQVLEALEKSLPQDHPDLQVTRVNLACALNDLDDLAGARALLERVLEATEGSLPDDHPVRQLARHNLSFAIASTSPPSDVRRLMKEDLARALEALPANHPDVVAQRFNVALSFWETGEMRGARELLERVLTAYEASHPADHPFLAASRNVLAHVLARTGDSSRLEEVLIALARDDRGQLSRTITLSLRETVEVARKLSPDLSSLLSFGGHSPWNDPLSHATFALVETMRIAASGGETPKAAIAARSEVAASRERADRARERLSAAVARAARRQLEAPAEPDDVSLAARERDAAESSLRATLSALGCGLVEATVESVSQALPPRAAAVGYLRYARSAPGGGPQGSFTTTESLLAFVVTPGGRLSRVEVGPMAAIEAEVGRWRDAIGAPFGIGSGSTSGPAAFRGVTTLAPDVAAVKEDAGRVRAAGEDLRRLVLDPVLAACGDARVLHVCLADVLHLVPIDALPLDDGFVGDRYLIRTESSFARILRPRERQTEGRSTQFVCVGDVDYEARGEALPEPGPSTHVAPPIARLRGDRPTSLFHPLQATRAEIDAIAATFAQRFGSPATVLTGAAASKPAVLASARGARYLHLATHGYFAPDVFRSFSDTPSDPRGWRRMSLEETVTGMAPMTLCGLGLAGANRGADALGRVPGILTAEEIAGLDLGDCDLAVLSACETNVGLRRAGEGIASLQSALHAAGARSAITSLWKVEDRSTRDLMVDFYRRLWIDGRPKGQALWESKCALRRRGAPTRAWAGFLLSGDPD